MAKPIDESEWACKKLSAEDASNFDSFKSGLEGDLTALSQTMSNLTDTHQNPEL